MADANDKDEPPLVERWLQEQLQWQRTLLTYLDSMTKSDEFLVHLGNAMRGSLLAGKPYPTAPAPGVPTDEAPADDRLDQMLFALHQLQGQVQDLAMTVEELSRGRNEHGAVAAAKASKAAAKRATRKKPTPTKASSSKTGTRKGRV